ncbi:hypothetical protein GQ600_22317 [Phytophthora cactorum]|nr:hypothetical protein GQ600_22317 [Phytophthora cactorum]
MRFMYLLLVAATVLLSSPGVVGAKQSTVAGQVLSPTRSMQVTRRDFCGRTSGSTTTLPTMLKKKRGRNRKTESLAGPGKSPGQVRQIKLPKAGYSGEKLDDLAKQYGDAYRARYSTFKGQ